MDLSKKNPMCPKIDTYIFILLKPTENLARIGCRKAENDLPACRKLLCANVASREQEVMAKRFCKALCSCL